MNHFQPSMKLRTKHRDGARVRRTYEPAQTPFQRLVDFGVISQGTRGRLEGIYRTLDPARPGPTSSLAGRPVAAWSGR